MIVTYQRMLTLVLCFLVKVWFHPGLAVWLDARELADGASDARAVSRE